MSNAKASLLSTVAGRKAAIIEALSAHISFDNIVRTFENDSACVTFDVLVDGKVLDIPGLEWTDEDGDLVREDRDNDVNRELIDALHEALPGTSDTIDTLDFDFDHADTYVAFFALLQRAVEATSPSDPEGDKAEWADDWSDRIAAMDAARAQEDEEDARLRLDYSNALINLDDIIVAGSSTAEVQSAFDALTYAALSNPYGQDVIREAKEVLLGTQWQLGEDGQTIVEAVLDDEKDDGELAAELDRLAKFHTDFQKSSDSDFYGDAYLKVDGICEGTNQKPIVLGFGSDDDDHTEIVGWLRELRSQASAQLWSRIVEAGKIVFCDSDSGEYCEKYPVTTYFVESQRQRAA